MMSKLLRPTTLKRALFFVACDYIVFTVAMYGAFYLRFDGHISRRYLIAISAFLLLSLVPKYASNAAFRLYNLTWRFVGTREVINVFYATAVGSMAFGMLAFFVHEPLGLPSLPRSVLLMDFMLTLIGVGSVRMAKRVLQVTGFRSLSYGGRCT
jgi:FlaA1/EpsC-like NDP-sugar epimerase